MNEVTKKEIERLRLAALNAPTLMHSIGYYNNIYDLINFDIEAHLVKPKLEENISNGSNTAGL